MRKKMKEKYLKTAAALMSVSLLFACSDASISNTDSDAKTETANTDASAQKEISERISGAVSYTSEDEYSDWENGNSTSIELKGTDAEFDSTAAVLFKNGTLTIKAGGTYVLSGTLTDGQIVVDAEDKNTVRLILNGVEISSSDTAAIQVVNAEKTVISLAEGTKNVISDGKQYVFEDSSTDEPNAAIFSKDDLTINGTGQLTVAGNYNNGITSKDDLKITGGTIHITAVDDGLMGRDLVAVKDGKITIKAGGDGIKSSNDKDTSKGNIALEGGTFTITAANDGVQAEASLWVTDGSYTIASGGGSPETITTNNERMKGFGQNDASAAGSESAETTNTSETETASAKALKSTADMAISGGTFTIDSLDDAVHSNAKVTIGGGKWTIASGDDGIHADTALTVSGGTIKVTKSYEGMEGTSITIDDGDIDVTAADDGINIGGGKDGSGMDIEADTAESLLTINGGSVAVNANGDGLDSNGSIQMTGGTVIVNGPKENMNGPLDYDGSFDMTGGFLVAVGSSGMVQAPSEESTQLSISMTYPEMQAAETMVHLKDSEGNEVASFVPAKSYQSVVISSPELAKDSSYSLYSGGTSTGTEANGLYTGGTYEAGTKVIDFTIADTVTWLDENGVTEAGSTGTGGPGGGGRPENANGEMTPPEGEEMGGMFSGLDEETREKVQAIMEQERSGTITREEAQKQMAALGVEIPQGGGPQEQNQE